MVFQQGLFKRGELVGGVGVIIHHADQLPGFGVDLWHLIKRNQVNFSRYRFSAETFLHNIFDIDCFQARVFGDKPFLFVIKDNAADQVFLVDIDIDLVVINQGIFFDF